MIRRLILAGLLAAIGMQAAADRDHGDRDWRGLMQSQGYLRDGPRDMWSAPLVAPPVIVSPQFGQDRQTSAALPRDCLQAIETPDGWRRIYDGACLAAYSRTQDALPRICSITLTTWGDVRRGYDPQCLADAGYRQRR